MWNKWNFTKIYNFTFLRSDLSEKLFVHKFDLNCQFFNFFKSFGQQLYLKKSFLAKNDENVSNQVKHLERLGGGEISFSLF